MRDFGSFGRLSKQTRLKEPRGVVVAALNCLGIGEGGDQSNP